MERVAYFIDLSHLCAHVTRVESTKKVTDF